MERFTPLPHPNRSAHNWLVYRATDRWLHASAPLLHGSCYDLGAGESPYQGFFLRYCSEYVAVDWPQSQHSIRADVLADLNEPLPIASCSADTVVCISVLEHLHQPQQLLCEAARILRPDGNLLLQVPWQWHIHEAPHDYFRYTPFALARMLESASLEVIRIEASGGLFSLLALKFNYFTRRFVRGPKPLRVAVRVGLTPIWALLQSCAPVLGHLDRDWAREAPGYFVIARKPSNC